MKYLAGVMVVTAACGGGSGAADAPSAAPQIAFVESAVIPVSLTYGVQAIGAGDLDDDGAPDIYLRGADQGLARANRSERDLLRNDGAGHLTESTLAATAMSCGRVLIGDVTHDGRADVTCIYGSNPGLDVEAAASDGTLSDIKSMFQTVGWVALVDAPAARGLVSADGTTDLSALVTSDGSTTITRTVIASAPAPVNTVASGDVDGDGVPDLIAAAPSSARVSFFDGTTLARHDYIVAADLSSLALVDGLPRGGRSLVSSTYATSGTPGTVTIVPLVGGVPQAPATYTVPAYAERTVGDLDGDGVPDLIFVGINDPSVLWLRGQPDGSLQPATPVAVTTPVTGHSPAAVVDLDRDGRSELVLANTIPGGQLGLGTTTVHIFHAVDQAP